MPIRCGIVGLPDVGKSTLSNALTAAGIAAENYPFCTIDPNVGVVAVPDPRLQQLAAIVNPQKVVPTTVEFVDIAGLVEGTSKGEGLGNQFLANIRETNAIAHGVRCFVNDDVVHVAGKVDPAEYKPNKTPGRRGLSGRRADPRHAASRRRDRPPAGPGRAWKGLAKVTRPCSFSPPARRDLGSECAGWRQHPVESRQVHPRHQRRQPRHEVQRQRKI